MCEYDSVGTIAFFRERHRVESRTTLRVLAALPVNGLSYSPHPQSPSAGSTAWTIVRCLNLCNDLLRSSAAAVSLEPYQKHTELAAEFETSSGLLADGLHGLKQNDWMVERSVTSHGTIILAEPLGQILWLFHFDSLHHRGQLSTYLRPLGAKVPSIYGPSGDEPARQPLKN
jgi:uncharacterized damage-inducible protein DinB